MLYANEQQRSEKDKDTQAGCHKPAVHMKTTELNRSGPLKVSQKKPLEIIGWMPFLPLKTQSTLKATRGFMHRC